MNTKDHGRKEPSLSDLEAFETLLRESLQEEPVAAARAGAQAPPVTPFSPADRDAMAELTRLIEQPLDFSLPNMQVPPPAAAATPDLHTHIEASFSPEWAAPQQIHAHQAQHSLPVEPEAPLAAPAPLHSVSADDPLAAFEEELRRFDASRVAVPQPMAAPTPESDFSSLSFESAPAAAPETANLADRHYAEEQAFHNTHFGIPAVSEQPVFAPDLQEVEHHIAVAPSPLEAAEQRLAAEAAAASYAGAEPQSTDIQRSRGVFVTLGVVAAAGLAIIGGTFAFSGAKKTTPGGDIPVIAAKTEPTKEKPADPGGVEIPNQNAQILGGRDVTKNAKPAEQVVNTTEQPLDLKEVTRRDSVRVVAPSPFQTPSTPTAADPNAASVRPADVEPRRVTSVKVPVGGEAAAPSTSAATIGAAAGGGAAIAAIAAGAARNSTPPPKADPKPDALRMDTPKSDARPPKKAEPKADAPKIAPTPKVANASATPKVAPPEKAAPRNANAPMSLTSDKSKTTSLTSDKSKAQGSAKTKDPAKDKAKATPAASGTFAVQLASRPTEADAKSAAASLGSKYSGQLGGKGARVVSGEANGSTVYRVRASGYSQAAATEVCNKIKAAGGACFIAKQ